MSKIILLIVILFLGYWGLKYYNKSSEKVEVEDESDDIDALIAYYEHKIAEIEKLSVDGISKAEKELERFKDNLDKLNKLKTNNKQ